MARIAVGGMAEVWRAHATLDTGEVYPVAIKRVLPQIEQPLFRAMFEDEARLGMRLRHPNIVRVYDARDVGGTFIMVMELVEGDSLKNLLDAAFRRGAPMPLAAALHIARELAAALAYAHAAVDEHGDPLSVIHRDVSPHNLLLGGDGAVKLTDFGLADASVHESARSEDLVGGKLGYLAPELILQKPHDHRIDVFALGIVLWEMLAGRRLFQGQDDPDTLRRVAQCQVPSLRALHGRVPEAVDDLLAKLLHRDTAQRVPTAAAAHRLLDALVHEIDDEVSARDVALLVGLHAAQKRMRQPSSPAGLAELLAQDALAGELEAFAAAGAKPLDPSEFARGMSLT